MKLRTNWLVQIVSTAGQLLNAANALPLPEKARPWIAFGIGLVQLITGLVAHNSNPDGSPAATAATPYIAPMK